MIIDLTLTKFERDISFLQKPRGMMTQTFHFHPLLHDKRVNPEGYARMMEWLQKEVDSYGKITG